MTQYINPASDTTNTGVWTTTPLWSKVDDGPPSTGDGTVVVSDGSPSAAETFVCAGTTAGDPAVSTGHILEAKWAKNASGGANYIGSVEIRQGYVSEASLGTLIVTLASAAISGTTLQVDSVTLSTAQAGAITDYSALSFRCWAAKSGGGANRAFKIDYVSLRLPDAAAGPASAPYYFRKMGMG